MIKETSPFQIFLKILLPVLLLALAVNAINFGLEVHSSYVRSDMWRYIQMYLIPISNGDFDWRSLWQDSHSDPLTPLIFIINSLYFDLTFNLFFYIGIVSKVLVGLGIYLFIKKHFIHNEKVIFLFSLVVISHFFSNHGSVEYGWPLVLKANLPYLTLLFVIYYLDKIIQSNYARINVVIFCFLSVFMVFSSRSLGYLFIASIVITLFFLLLNSRNKPKILALILFLILIPILMEIFLFLGDIHPKSGTLIVFSNFNIESMLNTFSIGMLSGLIRIDFLKTIGGINSIYVGYVLLLLYVSTIYFYVKSNSLNLSILPVVLMLYPLFFILGVALYRYHPKPGVINWLIVSPRYLSVYKIGLIGMFLSWGMIYVSKCATINYRHYISGIFLVLIILSNLGGTFYDYKASPYIKKNHSKLENFIFNYSYKDDLSPLSKSLGSSFSKDKVDFLRKNKLNVFNERYEFINKNIK